MTKLGNEYELISVISHQGNLTKSGKSNGHNTCDIRYHHDKKWYMTNDSKDPVKIRSLDVSRYAYVILFER